MLKAFNNGLKPILVKQHRTIAIAFCLCSIYPCFWFYQPIAYYVSNVISYVLSKRLIPELKEVNFMRVNLLCPPERNL